MAAVAIVVVVMLITIMVNSVHGLDESFKNVKFRGLYEQPQGNYLVLFEKNGEISGSSFFTIDEAKAFMEAIR